uniref:BCL6 corepressor n=1 Tax=Hucho hucho TaxID=62062 RepID=A0A4W5KW48_9TELE
MSLPHMPMPGKGPVYPHPVLLGSSSLYPPRLPPKHGLPYGIPSSHGDYLTFHDSQEMVHPLMSSPHTGLDLKTSERLQELRSRPKEKVWQHHEDSATAYKSQTQAPDTKHTRRGDRETDRSTGLGSKSLNHKPLTGAREEIVCIDLIQDDGDSDSPLTKAVSPCAKRGDPSKPVGSESIGRNEGREAELQHISSNAASCGWASTLPPSVLSSPPSPPALSPAMRRTAPALQRAAPSLTCQRSRPFYDDQGCPRARRSSLAKRIANSSGYVGDRIKCVTTELYADSSKLSREQRALQVISQNTYIPNPFKVFKNILNSLFLVPTARQYVLAFVPIQE